jgi:DNA-binding GntR family transcriptional regulator
VAIKLSVETDKSSLREQIVRVIRESILEGALQPGERLVEAVLAKEMNVSRAPLREAFWLLAQQGYLRVVPHEGTSVVDLTAAELRQIHVLRDTLEPLAADGAALQLKTDDRRQLVDLKPLMRRSADANDYRQYFEHDLLFHQTIWKLSGNLILHNVLKTVCQPLFTYLIVNCRPSDRDFEALIEAHGAIVSALQRDGDRHLRDAVQRCLRIEIDLTSASTRDPARRHR